METESFEHLRKQGASDHDMLEIVKYKVLPVYGVSFNELVVHGMKFISVNKFYDYSIWEIYLNVLIREYRISKSEIEDIMKQPA